MNTIIAIGAAALVTLTAGHAFAQSDPAPKVAVSYADLDLSRASGRDVLEHRVEAAVNTVCPDRSGVRELRDVQAGRKCREQAFAGAQRQLAAIYDGRAFAQASIEIGPGKR